MVTDHFSSGIECLRDCSCDQSTTARRVAMSGLGNDRLVVGSQH